MKLSSGEVVVMDLEKIFQRRVQMERLCSVANIWKGLKKQHPKDHLAQRLNECQNFKARRELLTFLCSQVTVPVIGMLLEPICIEMLTTILVSAYVCISVGLITVHVYTCTFYFRS